MSLYKGITLPCQSTIKFNSKFPSCSSKWSEMSCFYCRWKSSIITVVVCLLKQFWCELITSNISKVTASWCCNTWYNTSFQLHQTFSKIMHHVWSVHNQVCLNSAQQLAVLSIHTATDLWHDLINVLKLFLWTWEMIDSIVCFSSESGW